MPKRLPGEDDRDYLHRYREWQDNQPRPTEPAAEEDDSDWVEVEAPPLEYGKMWQPSAIHALKKMHGVKTAAELHPSLAFVDATKSWPSPSFGVVSDEVLQYLRQTRADLISKGFAVGDDPVNPLGDGKSWALKCEPIRIPVSTDLLEIARQYQQECVPGAPSAFLEGKVVVIPLWPAAGVIDTGIPESGDAISARAAARQKFIKRRMKEKGWSRGDWAQESGVDYHTIADFLDGKTKPYASTRKKLAETLGVEIDDFPE